MHKSLCSQFLQSKNSIHFGIHYPLVLQKGMWGCGARGFQGVELGETAAVEGSSAPRECGEISHPPLASCLVAFCGAHFQESGWWLSGFGVWREEPRPPLTLFHLSECLSLCRLKMQIFR